MEKYVVGLDLGVASVGWAIYNSQKKELEKTGVRFFNQSRDAKDRRNVRNVRRRLKREDNRIKDVKKQLESIGFVSLRTIDEKLIEKRYKGIKEKISQQDIANIIYFLVSHRGYIPFENEEVNYINLGELLPCEYYYSLYKKEGRYRALNEIVKNSDNIREIKKMLEVQSKYYKEINEEFINKIIEILKRKRKFWEGPGGPNANQLTPYGRFKTIEDIQKYKKEKKNNPKYEKYLFEDLINKCEINIFERCAPKFNFYAEYFNFLNDFININFENISKIGNKQYIREERKTYKLNNTGLEFIKVYILDQKKISIKKLFEDTIDTSLDNISGMRKNKKGEAEFSTFEYYRYIKNSFENDNLGTKWMEDIEQYNVIIYYLTIAPGIIEIQNMITGDNRVNYKFSDTEYKKLGEIKKNKNSDLKYHSLSESVLKRAINDMLRFEMNFMQVRRKEDYDKEARIYFQKNYSLRKEGLPLIETKYIDDLIASPQVKKTLRQAVKVINAIINEKGGLPDCIAIESTKEMNGAEKKKLIEKFQKINEDRRKKAKEKIIEHFGEEKATLKNIEKVMLYDELNGHCAYCNEPLDLNEVISGSIEVEHILPLSKSFDNSYDNKTLACNKCNSGKNGKGNNTPYEYLNQKEGEFEEFEKRIRGLDISDKKINNFTLIGSIDKYSIKFISRNLRDTAYATTALIDQINIFNYYLEGFLHKTRVNTMSTPGQLTGNLRRKYNLEKNRNDGLYHHAVDAAIVASLTATDIGHLIIDSQNNSKFWKNNKYNIENKIELLLKVSIEDNIDSIRKINEENIKVSCPILKNPQGQLANADIYKIIEKNGEAYKIEQITNIYTYDFSNLTNRKKFEKLIDENDDTITLLCYDNNKKLFEYIRDIYNKYKEEKGNPFINYARDIYNLDNEKFDILKHCIRVPSSKNNSPVIKKLRYYTKITDPYLLNKKNIKMKKSTKIAFYNLSQVCTKVFVDSENNKFVFLPIYSISVNLKNGQINENNELYQKLYKLYIGDKKAKYLIDLYKGDYIEIIKANNQKISGYYSSFHKTLDKICLKNGSYFTKNDKAFTLYKFDILGNISKNLTYKAY